MCEQDASSIGSWIIRRPDASDQFRRFARPNSWAGGRDDKFLKRIWVAKPFDLSAQQFNLQFRWSKLAALTFVPN